MNEEGCITNALKQLNWPTFKKRRQVARLALMYICVTNQAAIDFLCYVQHQSSLKTRASHPLKLIPLRLSCDAYKLTASGREYPASIGYIYAVWAVVRKKSNLCWQPFNFSIMHASNSSHDSQAKFTVRSVIKCHKFRRNKKLRQLWSALPRHSQDSHNALNRSRTGKYLFFLIYSSRFLDGFEQLLAEATLCTKAHTSKM